MADTKATSLFGEDTASVGKWDLTAEDDCVWTYGYSAGIEVAAV